MSLKIIFVSFLLLVCQSDGSDFEDNPDDSADYQGFPEMRNDSSDCLTTDREDQGRSLCWPLPDW